MHCEPEPGDPEEANSLVVVGPRLTRRAVLAGVGSALLVVNGARAADPEELQLFFADDRHDEIVIAYGGLEQRWSRFLFGEVARFRLARESAVVEPTGQPRGWQTSAWTLVVEEASFPGRDDDRHRLTFRFSRDQAKKTGLWTSGIAPPNSA